MFSSVTKFLFLCEFLMAWTLEAVTCPQGWKYFDGSCYIAYNVKKNFDEAAQFCKEQGGYLVEIYSKNENDFVHSIQKARAEHDPIWIGLNDINQEDFYIWTGSDYPNLYTNWNTGEPNNSVFRSLKWGYLDEDCVEMQYDNGKWNDIRCNANELAPICERTCSSE